MVDQIILGIDPGTTVLGYGVLQITKNKLEAITLGVLDLKKITGHENKLKKIQERILQLIKDYKPDFVALESPFYGKNIQITLKLGRVQGVVMGMALLYDIPIREYAPLKIKKAITGNGSASKEQVAKMLTKLLPTFEDQKFLDATDALAVAVCHHFQKDIPTDSKSNTWGSFLTQNPNRIKS